MRLLVPSRLSRRIRGALRDAGSREIGGILMGEHVKDDEFAIRDLTIQIAGGTFATFVRMLQDFLAPLSHFFQRTGREYRRFNYLGEWHSHPSFDTTPSTQDRATLRDLVEDASVGANFAVLLVVRLRDGQLDASAIAFPRGGPEAPIELMIEEGDNEH